MGKVKKILFILSLFIYNGSLIAFSLSFRNITDALSEENKSAFLYSIILAGGVVIFQVASFYYYSKLKNLYVKQEMIDIRNKITNKLLQMDGVEFRKKEASDYISLIFNDLNLYEQNSVMAKIDMMEQISLALFACIGIIFVYPVFLIVVFLIAAVAICIPVLFAKRVDKWNGQLSNIFEMTTKRYLKYFSNVHIIHAGKYTDTAVKECMKENDNLEGIKCKVKNSMIVIQGSLMFLTTVLTLVVFILGGSLVFQKVLSVGALFSLIQLLFYVSNPIIGIMTTISKLHSIDSIKAKMNEILSDSQKLASDGMEVADLMKGLSVNNLYYKYPDCEKPAVQGVSYEFEKGKKYALLGDNGSGKSTLLKLIAGYLPLDKWNGEINIDTIPLWNLSEMGIWGILAYMEQDGDLLNTSIKENIKLGIQGNEEKITQWIKEFAIQHLYCNHTGESDDMISGGEKQKVIFLREIYRNRKILLADEPDSALDVKSAEKMFDIILQLDCICIIITHKISAGLKKFDDILVMKDGGLVEHGTYDELMKNRGEFYHLNPNSLE